MPPVPGGRPWLLLPVVRMSRDLFVQQVAASARQAPLGRTCCTFRHSGLERMLIASINHPLPP